MALDSDERAGGRNERLRMLLPMEMPTAWGITPASSSSCSTTPTELKSPQAVPLPRKGTPSPSRRAEPVVELPIRPPEKVRLPSVQ